MNLPVAIRPATADDMNYIISTWGKTLRPAYPECRTSDFVSALRNFIDSLSLSTDQPLWVACSQTESTVIYGWAAGHNGAVFYAYTRSAYRRQGVCKRLLAEMGLSDLGALTLRCRLTKDAAAYKATHHVRVVPVL